MLGKGHVAVITMLSKVPVSQPPLYMLSTLPVASVTSLAAPSAAQIGTFCSPLDPGMRCLLRPAVACRFKRICHRPRQPFCKRADPVCVLSAQVPAVHLPDPGLLCLLRSAVHRRDAHGGGRWHHERVCVSASLLQGSASAFVLSSVSLAFGWGVGVGTCLPGQMKLLSWDCARGCAAGVGADVGG